MDSTALDRQKRRIEKLKQQGIERKTVFVHRACQRAFDALRPLLNDPTAANALNDVVSSLQHPQGSDSMKKAGQEKK